MNVDLVFGTRPEWLKLYPVLQALRGAGDGVRVRTIFTGQQPELVRPLMQRFGVAPDVDLGDHRANGALTGAFAAILSDLDALFAQQPPDRVVVHGDTMSTFAGALAAYYRRLPVAHVEAGLRTHDLDSPYPEEFHRTVVRTTAFVHYSPTPLARQNLLDEGVDADRILVTGNTSIDMLRLADGLADDDEPPVPVTRRTFVVTLHRRENLPLLESDILPAFEALLHEHADLDLLWVLHPGASGPIIARRLEGQPRVRLSAPLDYVSLVRLLPRLGGVFTDSGGLTEECGALGVPTLVVRRSTERVEALSTGCAALLGTSRDQIVATARPLLANGEHLDAMRRPTAAYGDGHAAERIARHLLESRP